MDTATPRSRDPQKVRSGYGRKRLSSHQVQGLGYLGPVAQERAEPVVHCREGSLDAPECGQRSQGTAFISCHITQASKP